MLEAVQLLHENLYTQLQRMVHCVKSVQIRNFFLSVFSYIWTEFLNTEEQLLAPFLEPL